MVMMSNTIKKNYYRGEGLILHDFLWFNDKKGIFDILNKNAVLDSRSRG